MMKTGNMNSQLLTSLSANKVFNWELGKLSPFVQKHAQKPPSHPIPLTRRYMPKDISAHGLLSN
jgi:hypothetical protein